MYTSTVVWKGSVILVIASYVLHVVLYDANVVVFPLGVMMPSVPSDEVALKLAVLGMIHLCVKCSAIA